MKKKKETIAVGLSGGVDSSVTAKILIDQGHDVVGVFMRNWIEKESQEGEAKSICTATQDFQDAQRVCEQLDIPLYPLDFSKEYWDHVFSGFIQDLKAGYTPNPDILCNKEIKFKAMWEAVKSMGINKMATGHYAQSRWNFKIGRNCLAKGIDQNKDQSYFLYAIEPEILNDIYFPLGEIDKPQVRKIAMDSKLAVANKKDSTGICFIGERNFGAFLKPYIGYQEGLMLDEYNNIVGKHHGQAYYTIGQRKGLGLGGAGEPWFVAKKDVEKNTILVVRGYNHPLLYKNSLKLRTIHWHLPKAIEEFPIQLEAKIRYRQPNQKCTLSFTDSSEFPYLVEFDHDQRAITSHQSIVFYDENSNVVGGGLIV